MRGSMKRWSLLPIALTLLLAACEPAGPQPPVAVNHVHTTLTPATSPGPSAAPTRASGAPTTAAIDRCHTGGLTVASEGSQGALGTIVATLRVTNTGLAPCSLYGFVGMQMLDAGGVPLPTRVVRNGGFFSTQAGPSRFVLQPRGSGTFQMAWSDVPHGNETTCPQAAGLELTPPDEFDHLLVPIANLYLAPCGAGELDITPIRAAGAA